MLSPKEFNRTQKGDGIGFKTTESGKMMRIPLQKEAQHLQLMGDTGVGKTQLIMQCLRQIIFGEVIPPSYMTRPVSTSSGFTNSPAVVTLC